LATFASLNDLFTDTFPRLSPIAHETFLKSIFYTLPSKDKIQSVKCPIAIIHSLEDDLIPFNNAKKMYQSIKHQNKLFVEILGSHSKPRINIEQLETLMNFCEIDASRCYYVEDILNKMAEEDIFDIEYYQQHL
jgi:fermentation-respiration switch protein FrsA (DUF1100 family)